MAGPTPGTITITDLSIEGNVLSGKFSTSPDPKNYTLTFYSDNAYTAWIGEVTEAGYFSGQIPFTVTLSDLPSNKTVYAVAYFKRADEVNTDDYEAEATVTLPIDTPSNMDVRMLVDTNGDNIFPVAGGLPNDSITTVKIKDNAVTGAKLAPDSVTSSQIINNSVTSAKIGDGTVTTEKIANSAVTNAKLASNAVVTADFANGAVTNAKIANSAVTPAKMALTVSDTSLKFTYTHSGATSTKTGKLISLGSKLWAITFHGDTGIETSTSGSRQILIDYPNIFNAVYMGQCKYTKQYVAGCYTKYAVFGTSQADTYFDSDSNTASHWNADILIIGTRTV